MGGSRTLDDIMHLNNLRTLDAGVLLRHAWPALNKRLPWLASVVLGLLIAWLLAVLTWSLLPRPKSAPPIYKSTAAAPATGADTTGSGVAAMHLFGTPATGGAVNAPATTLNLTLRGIASGTDGRSFAIIASSGKGNVYAVGAQIPGGAKLQSIFPDHVLLNLNGQLQSLHLPKSTSSSTGDSTPAAAPPPVPHEVYGRTLPAGQNLTQLRNEIVQHPERLLDMMRAMPVMQNGKLEGYRVFPVGNSNAFSKLGLQPGDIVTAVNGTPLDNPAQSMQVLNNIRTSNQVSVTFTRNGQQETKILQFQNNGNSKR